MPKESKKFINPLLRPSQEVEAKGEPAARPQKSLASEPFLAETSIPSEVVNDPYAETFQEEPLAEMPLASANFSPSAKTSTSTLMETAASAKLPSHTLTVPSPVHSITSSPDDKKRSEEEEKKRPVSPDSQISSPVFADPEPDAPMENLQEERLPLPVPDPVAAPVNSYLRQSGTIARPEVDPYTYTETDTSTSTSALPASQPVQRRAASTPPMKPVRGEKKPRASFTAAEAVRRKRGALTFENTHERITLWIDKELKQAFEVLAYERELPKTALLNEAVADLLKKYDLQ